jgi:hypothetical protein
MSSNTIQLVDLDENLHTAYISGGRTRDSKGFVPPFDKTFTVGQAKSPGWRATKATAAALVELDMLIRVEAGEGVRLLDVLRDTVVQARARQAYETWVQSGRPEKGSEHWREGMMKAAFVARAGESHHQWGAAVDFDVKALKLKGCGRGSDEALGRFWEMASSVGFTPVISYPNIEQAEAWHFDHLGPLREVFDLYRTHGVRYGRPYALTARAGCVLAGRLPWVGEKGHAMWGYVQARLLVAGAWCGHTDGLVGKMTRAALELVDFPDKVTGRTDPSAVVAWLDEKRVGLEGVLSA